MNKKLVFILCAVSLFLVTAILVGYLKFKSAVFTSPVSTNQPTPTIVVEEMSIWIDPAEFSFQYPKSLVLNPHNEDQENYAHVELTSPTHAGNIIVWVKDTTADTIENWVGMGKIKNAIDSDLSGVPSKKVLSTGDNSKLTISAIQSGYLYQIEANLDDRDFWNKALDSVVSSFKFVSSPSGSMKQKSTDTSSDTGSVDSGGSTGDEEIIE
ncbi:hypothetical protein HY029_01845 [Candidatus Gottesmanbacteria bacterium]|nr:hypothetical protein [Candidatus Gottesmanbacteria bacterium]